MHKHHSRQNGFIPMLIGLLLAFVAVIVFAVMRVLSS